MTPLVMVTTLITHLFGGSAGREGTAVQMGGSMASVLGMWFNLSKEDTRIILMTGIAAGFGAVFGTRLQEPFSHWKYWPSAGSIQCIGALPHGSCICRYSLQRMGHQTYTLSHQYICCRP